MDGLKTGTAVAVVEVQGFASVSIPRGIQPLLRSSWNVATASEEWDRPRTVTPAQKGEARALLAELRERHVVAPTERLKNRLQAFLGHWFVADDAAMSGRFVDWMRCFSDFPLRAVDNACTDYLRNNEKRPSISALRALCQQHDELGRLIRRLEVIVSDVPVLAEPERASEEQRYRVGLWLRLARQQGMQLTPEQMDAFSRGDLPPGALPFSAGPKEQVAS